MSKKVRRVPVILDAGEIKDLPQEDIQMILRGADFDWWKKYAGENIKGFKG